MKKMKVYCLQGGGVTSLNSNGSGWNEDISFTLNSLDVHAVVIANENIDRKAVLRVARGYEKCDSPK